MILNNSNFNDNQLMGVLIIDGVGRQLKNL